MSWRCKFWSWWYQYCFRHKENYYQAIGYWCVSCRREENRYMEALKYAKGLVRQTKLNKLGANL